MNTRFQIGGRTLSSDSELFITAEIGVTCDYEVDTAKKLIKVSKDAGADAIKFNFIFPEESYSDREMTFTYEDKDGEKEENFFEEMQKYQFTWGEWETIKNFSDEMDIKMFSTAGSPTAIEYAEKLNLPAVKTGSWCWNNFPFFEQVASLNKPMLMDTGPAYLDEIAKILRLLEQEGIEQTLLVHCYHTEKPSEMNMRSIPYMRETFDCPVGFSSPDRSNDRDLLAISLGVSYLEKRLTLSRDRTGHHHILSLEPDEFQDYVKRMRDAHAALGSPEINPSPGDLEQRDKWYRRIVADQKIEAGTELTKDMLASKRPPDGVSPEYIDMFAGFTLDRSIEENDPIRWEDLQ